MINGDYDTSRHNCPSGLRYLYVIASKPELVCKLGITNNPLRRLPELQGDWPRINLFFKALILVDNNDAEMFERCILNCASLKKWRLTGEWFHAHGVDDMIVDIVHSIVLGSRVETCNQTVFDAIVQVCKAVEDEAPDEDTITRLADAVERREWRYRQQNCKAVQHQPAEAAPENPGPN